MSGNKTQLTDASVEQFIADLGDEAQRRDSQALVVLMREVTGAEPRMWGENIVGFDSYRYRYGSGRVGEWPVVAFSPRKQNFTLYLFYGFERHDELLARLGKHKLGKACLYLKRLDSVDQEALRELIRRSAEDVRAANPALDAGD